MSVLISLSIVSLICTVAAGTTAVLLHRSEAEISGWPTTKGVVLVSELRHTGAETFDHRRQLAWAPFVQYRYVVDEKKYVSWRVSTQMHREFVRMAEDKPSA